MNVGSGTRYGDLIGEWLISRSADSHVMISQRHREIAVPPGIQYLNYTQTQRIFAQKLQAAARKRLTVTAASRYFESALLQRLWRSIRAGRYKYFEHHPAKVDFLKR